MQGHDSLLERLQRGTKRKFFAVCGSLLAKPSPWHSRKPSHLKVDQGFLPDDSAYCIKEVCKHADLLHVSLKNRKCIVRDDKPMSQWDPFFVIETKPLLCEESLKFFSKFHSVLQVLLLALYDGKKQCFVARPVAMTATDRVSNHHDTIFEMSEDDFVAEYTIVKKVFGSVVPTVEEGLCLGNKVVKAEALLRRLHAFLDTNISAICPTQRSLLTIQEHFSQHSDFKLHFDCLYLLTNAELAALEEEGEPAEQYATSAFDLLYDVWVCCYVKDTNRYCLMHLSSAAWDKHRKGGPLQMTRYSTDICNFMDKEALCFQASRAAKHYHFNGLDFIIPESSVFYGKFKRNCIKA